MISRIYNNLPEVRKRREEERRREQYDSYRLKAQLYNKVGPPAGQAEQQRVGLMEATNDVLCLSENHQPCPGQKNGVALT